jgi:hypothetical protein
MSVPYGKISLFNKRKADKMSANVYTIESLLVGKNYRSNSLSGEIISAEPHPKGVWYEGCDSYLVEIRDSLKGGYAFRTVAVKVGE